MDSALLETLYERMQQDARLRDAIAGMAEAKRHLDNALAMELRAGVEGAGGLERDRIDDVVRWAMSQLLIHVTWTLIVTGEEDTVR